MSCMTPDELREIENRMELADAKLGVAEELGFAAAGFAALWVYVLSDSVLLAIGAFAFLYLAAKYKYKQEVKAAEDAFERATSED